MTTTQQQQQHVVAVPVPAPGHLNPLMRFCNLLASRYGVLVTFVNIDPVRHKIEELHPPQPLSDHPPHGVPASPTASEEWTAVNFRKVRIPVAGLVLAARSRLSVRPLFEALASIGPHLERLICKLNCSGPSVTCIVSDVSMTVPVMSVADKLSIPMIALVPNCASLLLLNYHVIQGDSICKTKVLEALARRAEKREIVAEGLEGLPTIYDDELPRYRHLVDDNAYFWEYTTQACEEAFNKGHAVLINSFEDLEAPALMALSKCLSVPVYGVGPLVEPLHKDSSTSLWKEDEACILWLDQQPPLSVLYISFGSVTILSQAQIEEIVAGLLASRQRFLWVFRPDLLQNSEYSSTFVSGVLSRSDGRGCVVNWAPQLRVLSHPSVAAFLTHCGWNSTIEAIVHGVPMLCWPYFADQFMDAKYVVEEWKVGLRFEASRKEGGADVMVERGEVERVIRAVMEGADGRALRTNAMGLKEASSKSLLPGGTSHNNIQALLRSLV